MDKRSPEGPDAAPAFDPATTPVPRRRMLVLMGATALAAGGGLGVILEACSSPPVTVTLDINPATMPPATPVEVPFKLTTSSGSSVSGSAWLVRAADGTVTAFDPRCTHAACRYKWAADVVRFNCNCHGGEFALDGTVLAGPPPRPLNRFPVHISGAVLTVDVPSDFQTPRESLGA
jgi:nitrite reductase/ring-hydroxylating ferredoxin subunit